MKKAAVLITALCFMIFAVAPVTVEAAGSDQVYYVTRQANINNQTMIDNGYNTAASSHYASTNYCVNSQIDAYNAALAQLPVQLSDYDYYYFGGQATTVSDDETAVGSFAVTLLNTDGTPILINSKSRPEDFYYSKDAYSSGVYTWGDGANNLYLNGITDLVLNDDLVIYDWNGSSWSKRNNIVPYSDCYLNIGGYITSTNFPAFYYGKDIWANSTANYTASFSLAEWKAVVASGVENSDNLMESFQVTADGTNYESWGDAYGDPDIELQYDTSLSLSSIDLIPLKDAFVGGMTATKAKGAFDFNTFDITFGGDQVKEAAAKSSYGLQFDVTVNYRVDTSYDKAVFQSLFGQSYSGSIHSTFYIDELTEENARNFEVSMTLSDLLENADSIVTGSKEGMALLALINYANEGERGSKTADFLGFGGMTLEDDAIVSETIGSVPLIGGIEESIRDWVSADYTYGLTELYYYADVTPYNDAVGIKGVLSDCECDMITGVHSGTAGGGTKTDPVTGETTVNPNYTVGPDQSYLLPTILPGGGSGEIVVSGSPSNSSANAQGGNANVTVNANPVINFQNGFEDFAKVMKLAENSNNVQKSFWGFFGVFKDNPAAELYRDYFGSFPEEFTKYILACCGICFGIGVYRFVRGRSV